MRPHRIFVADGRRSLPELLGFEFNSRLLGLIRNGTIVYFPGRDPGRQMLRWSTIHNGWVRVGFCEDLQCRCYRPGPVCPEFLGDADDFGDWRCPRCGYLDTEHLDMEHKIDDG